MFDQSYFPTPLEAPGVIAALYEEARRRANRETVEEHALFNPAVPIVTDSPDAAEWLAKVARVAGYGGR
jgi:hypothetical protein